MDQIDDPEIWPNQYTFALRELELDNRQQTTNFSLEIIQTDHSGRWRTFDSTSFLYISSVYAICICKMHGIVNFCKFFFHIQRISLREFFMFST